MLVVIELLFWYASDSRSIQKAKSGETEDVLKNSYPASQASHYGISTVDGRHRR